MDTNDVAYIFITSFLAISWTEKIDAFIDYFDFRDLLRH